MPASLRRPGALEYPDSESQERAVVEVVLSMKFSSTRATF